MNDEERLALGIENVKKVYGDVLSMPTSFDQQGFIDYSLRTLFGDIFARPRLSLRDRRLVILGVLAGLGADPSLFEIHLRSALGNGEINPDELREVIMTILPYAGYPKTSPLYTLTEKCLAAKD